ncbi:virion structural protein [Pseudomonas phage 201phi2-1]|uniref:Virion structural protein n=1 Tax=Pseudomonas phage 201phi2-1 TaxID=198110 RepID=B3FJ09_BP201|nr:virion structural protein [Pseudomonas phage 201phi2-1]ABY62976.1 virion structural protein [Pseudomonas phage 201phi2-1]
MRIGFEIARFLKDVRAQDGADRTVRATMVANALGYFYPVDPALSAIDNAEAHMSAARKVISQINENISLDTKLCLELFKQVMFIRLELINGPTDSSIIEAAMRSHTASLHQTSAETVAVTALVTNLEFARAQNGIRQVLSSVVTE